MILDDLPSEALKVSICGVDTETTGLDHRKAKPVLFQYHSEECGTYLIRLGTEAPPNVRKLMESQAITKVIHHAPFDLSMLEYNLGIASRNIRCTRIAIKLLDPDHKRSHSLASLMQEYLGITLSKEQRMTDWTAAELTPEQIEYAERDVKYLITLWYRLQAELSDANLMDKYSIAMKYLPMYIQFNTAPIALDKMYGY